jgi:hypothetical protein
MTKKKPDKDRARLQTLIDEATVDCYTEDEAHVGFLATIEGNVVCPFKARVIGEEVEVVRLRTREHGFGVDAVCRYKGEEYPIDINSLEWPAKKPAGFEWVEAYWAWLGGACVLALAQPGRPGRGVCVGVGRRMFPSG